MPVLPGVRLKLFMQQFLQTHTATQPNTVGLSNHNQTPSMIVRKQICDHLNISRSTLWRIERRDPTFPKPLNLGIKKEQWMLDEVLDWAESTRSVTPLARITPTLQ